MSRHATLDSMLDLCWDELTAGCSSAKHGFHQPIISTVDSQGFPHARMVVLRGVSRDDRTIWCHTDARAPKVAEIKAQPATAWTFYDRSRKLQTRLLAQAEILTTGPVWEQAWQRSRLSSRRCYMAPLAPGTQTAAPDPNLPESVRDRVPTEEETTPGKTNFAVLKGRVSAIDCLHLAHNGHIRAQFTWDSSGSLKSNWVAV